MLFQIILEAKTLALSHHVIRDGSLLVTSKYSPPSQRRRKMSLLLSHKSPSPCASEQVGDQALFPELQQESVLFSASTLQTKHPRSLWERAWHGLGGERGSGLALLLSAVS